MTIDRKQAKLLYDAILSAFDATTLGMAIDFRLDRKLQQITTGAFRQVAYDVIRISAEEGWAHDLVALVLVERMERPGLWEQFDKPDAFGPLPPRPDLTAAPPAGVAAEDHRRLLLDQWFESARKTLRARLSSTEASGDAAADPFGEFETEPRRAFLRNLGLFVFASPGAGGWLWRYGVSPRVGVVLLGIGILGLAFGVLMRSLGPRRRRDAPIVASLYRGLFESRRSAVICGAVLGVVVLLAQFVGAVTVQNDDFAYRPPQDRDVVVARRTFRLAPAQAQTLPVLTMWWSPATVRMNVAGYPPCDVRVRPFDRPTVKYPHYGRQLLLLKADPGLKEFINARQRKDTLVIETWQGPTSNDTSKATSRIDNWDGGPVWLGTDQPVEVPPALRRPDPAAAPLVGAIPTPPVTLGPGTNVRTRVIWAPETGDGDSVLREPFTTSAHRPEALPDEITIPK